METTSPAKPGHDPQHIRDSLSLEPGCKLIFDVNKDGELVLRQRARGGQIGSTALLAPPRSSWDAPPTNTWSSCAAIPMILLDANVILDIWNPDPALARSGQASSCESSRSCTKWRSIAIVYAEISVSFATSAALDEKLEDLGAIVISISTQSQPSLPARPTCNIAVKAERRAMSCPTSSSARTPPCSAARCLPGIRRRYAAYFPTVRLIAP